jgi:hypothetical protein
MGEKRSRSWVKVAGIAGAVLLLLVLAGVVGWRILMRYFVRQYYEDSYQPISLAESGIGVFPPEYHLEDVPWIASDQPVCQSTSLQMIAAQRGIDEPRRHFDFLMGFTYGTAQIPGGLGFYPGTDPETGFGVAAPYLGLVRRYYTTGDPDLFLDALRYFLSQGFPVRVGLDMGLLYDAREEGLPHSEVLVGYDDGGHAGRGRFYYYETVCLPETPCEPGRRPPGERGLVVSGEQLLRAIRGQAEMFDYPWRYALTVFEEGPREQDLGPIWTRNGQALIGGVQYGPLQGADVIDALADEIEKRGPGIGVAEILPGLEAAVYARRENATYLREAFPGDAEIESAATFFERAAGDYEAALTSLRPGIVEQAAAEQIAAWLRDAASAEREAGRIFVARGE